MSNCFLGLLWYLSIWLLVLIHLDSSLILFNFFTKQVEIIKQYHCSSLSSKTLIQDAQYSGFNRLFSKNEQIMYLPHSLGRDKRSQTKYSWPWNCLPAYVASRQTMREEKAGICMKASFLEYSDINQRSKEHFTFKRLGIKMTRNATVCEHKESF